MDTKYSNLKHISRAYFYDAGKGEKMLGHGIVDLSQILPYMCIFNQYVSRQSLVAMFPQKGEMHDGVVSVSSLLMCKCSFCHLVVY